MILRRLGKDINSMISVFIFIGIGLQLSAVLFGQFGTGIPIFAFLDGMFSGISVVFFLTGLAFFGRSRRKTHERSTDNNE